MSNASHLRGSAWLNFPRVLCERWSYENIVLMGDAAATAHFSIGSGTKLAHGERDRAGRIICTASRPCEAAFAKYEDARRTEVLRLQSAARNSLEWFEEVERYLHLDPVQFNYSLLTRSQRISHENLRLRDKDWLEGAEAWFQRQRRRRRQHRAARPMFAPFQLRDMRLKNRVVVSPMAQYKAVDGCPTDWHLVHYAERAKGGAGLVFIEMTCVSPEGRITPGCTGLYAPEHEAAWKRIVDFVHAETDAKICCQLGHSGAKGSTQLGWEEHGRAAAGRQLAGAGGVGDLPGRPRNQAPRAMTAPTWTGCATSSWRRPRWPTRAGFDMLELHCAHGYLLSSFITPLTNQRTDEYGGSLENRMRYPLEIFRAVRAVWPAEKPISVRISANDWVGDRRRRRRATRSRSRACCRRPASTSATSRPARPRSRRSRSMAACSRRRSPTASATRPAWRRWRSATSTSPTTSTRS